MITYVGDLLLSGWDWVMLAFDPLLPLGALLLAKGLWRSSVLDRHETNAVPYRCCRHARSASVPEVLGRAFVRLYR